MDEGAQPPEPKIPLIEALLIGTALTVAAVINLIPFAGDFTSPIIAALMFFYLYQKGLLGTTELVANGVAFIVGLVPILQAFPAWLISWPVTVWVANHPKLAAVAGKVGELTTGEGAISGAAGGAAAKAGGAAAGGGVGAARGGISGATPESPSVIEREARTPGEAGPIEGGEPSRDGGSPEEGPEAIKKTEREAKVEREMERGAEISPEQQKMEEFFNPEGAQFQEARPKTAGEGSREEDEVDEGREE